jgi:hypothetical protein
MERSSIGWNTSRTSNITTSQRRDPGTNRSRMPVIGIAICAELTKMTPAFSELTLPVPTTSTVAVGLPDTGTDGKDVWIVGDRRG